MIKVNTHEAKSKLSKLIAAVETADELVVICRNGKPVAELRRPTTRDPLRRDPMLANVVFREDPMAPLDPSDWPEP
jgi:antitoxin (DNA-binding transcriptional repressor) of toxin-antitoxin stability system